MHDERTRTALWHLEILLVNAVLGLDVLEKLWGGLDLCDAESTDQPLRRLALVRLLVEKGMGETSGLRGIRVLDRTLWKSFRGTSSKAYDPNTGVRGKCMRGFSVRTEYNMRRVGALLYVFDSFRE